MNKTWSRLAVIVVLAAVAVGVVGAAPGGSWTKPLSDRMLCVHNTGEDIQFQANGNAVIWLELCNAFIDSATGLPSGDQLIWVEVTTIARIREEHRPLPGGAYQWTGQTFVTFKQ